MYRAVGLIVFVALGSIGSPAAADLSVAGYGELGWGQRSAVRGLDDEFKDDWLNWRIAGGLRLGRVSVGVATSWGALTPVSNERHGKDRFHFGVGPEVAVFFGGETGWRPYIRLGGQRQWIGSATVRRQCSDFGVCDAGFWTDSDGYKAATTSLTIGVEHLFSAPAREGALLSLSAELGYEHLRFHVVDEKVEGGFIGFNIVLRGGGGRIVK